MSKKLINKARGLSDKAIAWIFVTPTILLLLAIISKIHKNYYLL